MGQRITRHIKTHCFDRVGACDLNGRAHLPLATFVQGIYASEAEQHCGEVRRSAGRRVKQAYAVRCSDQHSIACVACHLGSPNQYEWKPKVEAIAIGLEAIAPRLESRSSSGEGIST